MQKKNPLYNELKEETVWSMERFNAYVNEQFGEAKALPQDWVLGAFAVSCVQGERRARRGLINYPPAHPLFCVFGSL